MANFHTENIASILNKFDSNMEQGLSTEAYANARARYGANKFGPEEKVFPIQAFLGSLLTWRIIVLFLATVILVVSLINGSDGVTLYATGVVGAALILHIASTGMTVYRIRSRDADMNGRMVHSISVIRQGKLEQCLPEDIVPGDLLSLNAGDYVPADARIIESEGLMTDESSLFGTEVPVDKTSADLPEAALPPEKQKNMAFGGTYIVAGHGYAIVVKTGTQLEIWKQHQDTPWKEV